MATDTDVVSDLHKVIYLGAASDNGATEACAVESRISPNFDIIFEFNDANLRNTLNTFAHRFVAEPIGADDCATLQSAACTDHTVIGDSDARLEPTFCTNAGSSAKMTLSFKYRARANDSACEDRAAWANVGRWINLRRGINRRRAMDAGGGAWPKSRLNRCTNQSERIRGFFDTQEDLSSRGLTDVIHRHEHCAGTRSRNFRGVARICQEGEIAGTRIDERSNALKRTSTRGRVTLDRLSLSE